jgi:hypothetical protein
MIILSGQKEPQLAPSGRWQEKKRKAMQAGGKDWPLIAYADFTDYERVICKGDNWREVFAVFFVIARACVNLSSGCIRSGWTRCTLGQLLRTMSCCSMWRRGEW